MALHRKRTLAKLKQIITEGKGSQDLSEAVLLAEEQQEVLAKVIKNLANARKANRDYNKSIRKDKSESKYWMCRALAAEDKVKRSISKMCDLEDFLKELGLGLQKNSLLTLSEKHKEKKKRQEKLEEEITKD